MKNQFLANHEIYIPVQHPKLQVNKSIRISESTQTALQIKADKIGISVNHLINLFIIKGLQNEIQIKSF